ncbi:amino acid adenylation domain-containing protein [Xanthomonas campestris pv. campestris]|nr:amino acid adenylation domain-containing protein [Xanthomonas campestris pv. campestris]
MNAAAGAAPIQGIALSPQQRELWSLIEGGLADPATFALLRLDGAVPAALLEAGLRATATRHEILRTRFVRAPGMRFPLQCIEPVSQVEAIAAPAGLDSQAAIAHWFGAKMREVCEAGGAPLAYARLEAADSVGGWLCVGVHALCADRAGMLRLLEEVGHAIADAAGPLRSGEPQPEPIQYADLGEWFNELLEDEQRQSARLHWLEAAATAPLQLPMARAPAHAWQAGPLHRERLDEACAQSLRACAAVAQVSPEAVLLAAWEALLLRVCEAPGSLHLLHAGRAREELREAIGPVQRRLPFTASTRLDDTFATAVASAQALLTQCDDWADYCDPASSAGHLHAPLLEFVRPPARLRLGVPADVVAMHAPASPADLHLRIAISSDGTCALEVEWNAARYERGYPAWLMQRYRSLLTAALGEPATIAALPLLEAGAWPQVLGRGIGAAPVPFVPFHRRIEQVAARTPGRVAVVDARETIDHRELNARANRIAHALTTRGIGRDDRVGVCMARSVDLVAALLGVIKAGAAYLPLDPTLPDERLDYMVRDAQARWVIADDVQVARPACADANVLAASALLDRSAGEAGDLDVAPAAGDLAYVIYTSGSTGRPKGVLVEHGGVANYLDWAVSAYDVGPETCAPVHASIGFDATVTSLFPALMAGGRLRIIAEGAELDTLAACLRSDEDWLLKITPAHLDALDHACPAPLSFARPVRLVVGGEALPTRTAAAWARRSSRIAVFNEYGPTETVVGCSVRRFDAETDTGASVPIGDPIRGAELYVLDAQGRPAADGLIGELWIGGAGVARGYHGRDEETRRAFVPNRLGTGAGRLYRSGDLVRRDPASGLLEYLGRADAQIKLRGHRIEPGEIEAALAELPGVESAAVLCLPDAAGHPRLVAFVAARVQCELASANTALASQLPAYMLPSAIVTLAALPVTGNGKIDRQALAAIQVEAHARAPFRAPRSGAERALAEAWSAVLGVADVGLGDRFLDMGGDSILAIKLRVRMQQAGLDLPLLPLLDNRDLETLAAGMRAVAAEATPMQAFALLSPGDRARVPEDAEDAYPISRLQMGMLFHSLAAGAQGMYIDVDSVRIRGRVDAVAMRTALERAVARHPALRTSFSLSGYEVPVQIVRRHAAVALETADWSGLDTTGCAGAAGAWVDAQRGRGFDVAEPGLLRLHLADRGDGSFQFGLCRHHAILDGWSAASLIAELADDYAALSAGRTPPQTPPPASGMREFVALEGAALASQAAQDYWRKSLDQATVARLPRQLVGSTSDAVSNAVEMAGAAEPCVRFELPDALSSSTVALSRRCGVPVATVLLAAHMRWLSWLSGGADVTAGVVSNARPEAAGGDQALGLFLNTLPLRVALDGGSWLELVGQVRAAELAGWPQRRYPWAAMQRDLALELDVLFNFVHFHVYQGLARLQGFEMLGRASSERTSFALLVNAVQTADSDRLAIEFHYDPTQFARAQIDALGGFFLEFLRAMAEAPQARYERCVPLGPAQRHQLLEQWNATGRAYPEASVPALFEAQVQRTPDATALCDAGGQWSYAELDARANRLAHYLRAQGVSAGDRVGVCLARDASLVAALLGVLKAGACYVPLDPAYPAQRLDYMLSDAQAQVVLCDARWADSLSAPGRRMCCLDQLGDALAGQPTHALGEAVAADALAYLIYTSGSTGQPKGVAIEHRNVSALLHWAHEAFPVPERACVLASTSVCFDLSAFELYVPLTAGGRVWMVENVLALPHLPADAAVSWVNTVPSAMAELVRQGPLPASVVAVGLAGEPLHGALTQAVYAVGAQSVYNLYGPSEDTTYSTWYRVGREEAGAISIGRPIANTRAYLLDAHGEPVAAGAVGELYLAGAGVARGYLGREALTRERFLADRFGGQGRMYRTGDLARYRADGTLEFLGRADHQVKLRGYRIELGEIEAELRRHAGVKEAAVVLQAQGGGRLLAYVSGMTADDEAALRAHLRARLPDYMVPGHWVWLEALPHTANGKIDRQRLPTPPARARSGGALPQSATERTVAAIWSRLLALPEVALDDGFFESGGHSLLVMQLQGELVEQFGAERGLSIAELFEFPTVRSQARRLDRGDARSNDTSEANEAIRRRAERQRAAQAANRQRQGRG